MFRRLNLAVVLLSVSLASGAQEAGETGDVSEPLDPAVPVADVPTEDDVFREFARFRQMLEEENYDEADIAAKRVVQMSIEIFGPQSHETAKALNNLAIVQHSNKQYDAAIQNFTSAIEILEVIEDRLNEQLVNPLKGLGAAQLNNGRPDLATRTLDRATHITHVNEGPHNYDQVEILESLAEANVRLGDIEAARDVLDRIHILNVRHFEDNALGLLPSLMRRASWQHRAGYYNDERATYRRAIRIIEESAGKDDPRLIDPLLKLGESFYYYEPITDGSQRGMTSSAELYLKRAVRIVESAEDVPWLDDATVRLALADYYVFTDSHNRARDRYAEAWDILSAEEDRLDMRNALMVDPTPIWQEPVPAHTTAAGKEGYRPGETQTGTITVDYMVSARGRVSRISTEADPPEFTEMQRMVHREIRRRVFRPQIVDGIPVDSGEQRFRHEFTYLQSELNDLRNQAEGNTTADEET
jgi:tetratricopeptide (TPR) repeat protein